MTPNALPLLDLPERPEPGPREVSPRKAKAEPVTPPLIWVGPESVGPNRTPPGPVEIQALCIAIRKEWSDAVRRRRETVWTAKAEPRLTGRYHGDGGRFREASADCGTTAYGDS